MRTSIVFVLAALAGATGCSPSSTPGSTASAGGGQASPESQLDPATTQSIAASAEGFMRAILAGNAPGAAQWLTARGVQQYSADPSLLHSFGMQVERMAMGEVRLLSPYEAAAQCLVHEPGGAAPQEVCCLLKREAAGWRVCGLACDADGSGPSVMSFEEPRDNGAAPSQFVGENPSQEGSARTAAQPAGADLR